MSHMTFLMILPNTMSWGIIEPHETLSKPLLSFFKLNSFALSNMSKCSQTWCTCSNGLIMHLDQMAQVGDKYILIKVPQNPLRPESNLTKFALPTFSP